MNEELVIAHFYSLNDIDSDVVNDVNLLANRISNMNLATNNSNNILKPIALRPAVNQLDSQVNITKKNSKLKTSSSCFKNEHQTECRPHLNFVKMIIQTFIESKLSKENPTCEIDFVSYILNFSKMSKLSHATESTYSCYLYKNFIEIDLEKIEQDLN